jgi:divalent metal cation (Fe/Co/Zn/Cd) transporter
VKIILQILISFTILASGYECMVEAFHLLNEPSDRAVATGTAMLALLCVFVPAALWLLWRERHDNFR